MYVCWTGGLDSTCLMFWLQRCQQPAQPLYLVGVDGRQNTELEQERMHAMAARFGFRPPLVVPAPPLSAEIRQAAAEHQQLGLSRHACHQYAYLEQWLRQHAALGLVAAVQGDAFTKAWQHPVHGKSVQNLYRSLRLPWADLTKSCLVAVTPPALLAGTVTCWYPRSGAPCGRCRMCRARADI